MFDSKIDLSTALEMTGDGILRIKIMVLITFLLKSPH